jgi:hypothetical protein
VGEEGESRSRASVDSGGDGGSSGSPSIKAGPLDSANPFLARCRIEESAGGIALCSRGSGRGPSSMTTRLLETLVICASLEPDCESACNGLTVPTRVQSWSLCELLPIGVSSAWASLGPLFPAMVFTDELDSEFLDNIGVVGAVS